MLGIPNIRNGGLVSFHNIFLLPPLIFFGHMALKSIVWRYDDSIFPCHGWTFACIQHNQCMSKDGTAQKILLIFHKIMSSFILFTWFEPFKKGKQPFPGAMYFGLTADVRAQNNKKPIKDFLAVLSTGGLKHILFKQSRQQNTFSKFKRYTSTKKNSKSPWELVAKGDKPFLLEQKA